MTVSAFRARVLLAGVILLSGVAPSVAGDGWGSIEGQVVFDGAAPEREKLKVDKDQAHCLSKGALLSETLIVNPKNKGVKNAVVFLIDASGDAKKKLPINPRLKALPKAEELIDQPCCQFVPHVLAVRKGQGVAVKNSAPISHAVQMLGGPLEFNVTLPAGGVKKVPAADLPVRSLPTLVKCTIHPWMGGYLWVFDHPYFAVTDEDGTFRIRGAPAGDWRIVIWHESKGWVFGEGDKKSRPIAIKDGDMTDLGTIMLTPSKE
jgi:hypothetical protein